ncbi:GntR family transcriptional regulator [Actinoalloteichus hymeniacidonis]|uniref:Transcriptional regulator n=1 Tax=Actinoalloteichus hymeniacidonis TaxID=340345 RepID=A0AAC9HRE1_9PSEU|nr:GntR family transcriptional regulator [Actinoalloteichus hymeniacidonis]AOS64257.1 transcriptional regulator [Actinoalloteichus hymeniacidonis]MBB5907675.1 DNA-binding GntR family transcriptional regulator [Actinoalloteichus hymeniacidonis]
MARSLLRDDAYRAIRDAIVDGTLAPGERLVDSELIDWLGVSRTPIREALSRLDQAGLVRSKPGRYTIVAPLDVRATREAQAVAAALHELAVRSAVPALTETELALMRQANQRLAEALEAEDVDGALAADDDFHAVTVTAAANETLHAMLDQVTPLLRRVERVRFASLAGRGSVAQHSRIIELCAAGEAEHAAVATRHNWETLEPLLHAEETDAP